MSRAIRPLAVPQPVPALLGFIAGFVDICAFLGLFHIFVAQLTGSFVYAGAQLASRHAEVIAVLAIPVFFAAGCLATMLALHRAPRGHALAWVLGFECVLLTAMLLLMLTAPLDHANAPGVAASALLGIAAMGVQSAMVRLFLRGVPSTNVMTTNTTQLAIDITTAFLAQGGKSTDAAEVRQRRDARERIGFYWPPMAGFIAGTAIGALGYELAGAIALAAPLAAGYGLLAWCLRRQAEPAVA